MEMDTPVKKIAILEFIKHFGDLLGIDPRIEQYEFGLISTTYELAFIEGYGRKDFNSMIRTGRVAAKLLEQGATVDLTKVATAYIINTERIPGQLNKAWRLLGAAKEIDKLDLKSERILTAYKSLYESGVTAILAPIIVGLGLTAKGNQTLYKLDRDGRVKISSLGRIHHYSNYPRKQLSIGLNSHIRNAFSHDRYTLLDNGEVELWDVSPKTGNLSWGPERWSNSQLFDLYADLWRNCLGMIFGISVFSIAFRNIIQQSKLPDSVEPLHDPVREEDINAFLTHSGRYRGFRVESCSKISDRLVLGLRTSPPGVDQDSEIFTGSPTGKSMRYSVSMKYFDEPVIAQAIGLLQELAYQTRTSFDFEISVMDFSGEEIGMISGHSSILSQPKGTDTNAVRNQLEIDTLGDHTMSVLVEGYPRGD